MDEMAKSMMLTLVFILTLFVLPSQGRIFSLDLKTEERREVPLSTFGFLKKGTLAVNMTVFAVTSPEQFNYKDAMFGFTLDKSGSKGISSYMEDNQGKCILQSPPAKQYTDSSVSIIFFKMNFKTLDMTLIRRGKGIKTLQITDDVDFINRRLNRHVMSKPKVLLGDEQMVGRNKAKREASIPKPSTTTMSIAHPPKSSAKASASSDKPGNGKPTSSDKPGDGNPTSSDKPGDGKPTSSDKPKPTSSDKPGDGKPTSSDKPGDSKPTSSDKPGDGKPTSSDKPGDSKPTSSDKPGDGKPTSSDKPGDSKPTSSDKPGNTSAKTQDSSMQKTIKMYKTKDGEYSAFFAVAINTDEEEGLYNLYFHNCYNYPKEMTEVHLMLGITEANDKNFLSAGGMPIPKLFFGLFVVYVLTAIVWSTILKRGSDDVYKIHYLMLSVITVKSLSCLFRSINSHFISVEGFHREAWAVLYYIVYLTKGALLFSTILLIGAGWAFVKHILSVKEKKLFLIILPLQVQ
ncbi:protein GPR107-like [Mizuhopecten yessoensis]|uniref:protein GPR107-like n=1 Tax=Mizuhopecten yessoensis TaxID=6573 RepID=UPI000B4573C4|nr:protein GPR107-like [Mizuhopecten yessoensis]